MDKNQKNSIKNKDLSSKTPEELQQILFQK